MLRDFTFMAPLEDQADEATDAYAARFSSTDGDLDLVLDVVDATAADAAERQRIFESIVDDEDSLPAHGFGPGAARYTNRMLRRTAKVGGVTTGVTTKTFATAEAAKSKPAAKPKRQRRQRRPQLKGWEGRQAAVKAGGSIVSFSRRGSMMTQVIETRGTRREFTFPASKLGL